MWAAGTRPHRSSPGPSGPGGARGAYPPGGGDLRRERRAWVAAVLRGGRAREGDGRSRTCGERVGGFRACWGGRAPATSAAVPAPVGVAAAVATLPAPPTPLI